MPPIQPALLACSPHARSMAGIVAAKVADGIRLAIRPNDSNAVALVAGLMKRRSTKVSKRTDIPCARHPHYGDARITALWGSPDQDGSSRLNQAARPQMIDEDPRAVL